MTITKSEEVQFSILFYICFIEVLPMQHKFCCVNIISRSWRTWKTNQRMPTYLIYHICFLCLEYVCACATWWTWYVVVLCLCFIFIFCETISHKVKWLFIRLAHFSFDMKHVTSVRLLANWNQGCSHFPNNFWIPCNIIALSKWRFSCLIIGHIGLPPPPSPLRLMLTIEPRILRWLHPLTFCNHVR